MEKPKLIDKANWLVEQYNKGAIGKYEYLDEMSQFNEIIFFLSGRLGKTVFKKIEIVEGKIIFTTKSNIQLQSKKFDKLGIPSMVLSMGYYEEEESLIYQLIKDRDVVLDVGANIGWFSLNLGKTFTKLQILAFEPIPEIFSELTTNVSLNQLDKQILLYNFGLSDSNGIETFFYSSEEASITSSKPLGISSFRKRIKANVSTLDNFVTQHRIKKMDFFKCDAEGSELNIIKGGLKTLSQLVPIIMIELYEGWTKHFDYTPQEVISILKSLGYKCYLLDDDHLREIVNYEKDARFCNEDLNNFFFLHKNKHAFYIEKFSIRP